MSESAGAQLIQHLAELVCELMGSPPHTQFLIPEHQVIDETTEMQRGGVRSPREKAVMLVLENGVQEHTGQVPAGAASRYN